MVKIEKKHIYWVLALNLAIALGYFLENRGAGYSQLSSDINNIIPVCQKFDDPTLYQGDLFVNELDNVRYYTPFYVQTLRFLAKFTRGDYVQAVNVLGLFLHLFYGIFWFLLFYKYLKDFWLSILLSVLIRGLVWLPGFEIWGISDLWSVMPRTFYLALMPIPFLFYSVLKPKRFLLSAFLIALVFNFHPISGLGGILLFVLLTVGILLLFRGKSTLRLKHFPVATGLIVIGMLPFLLTYFTKTDSAVDYDMALYKEAFSKRIPSFFEEPSLFLKKWLGLKTLFFVFPLLGYFLYALKHKSELKKALLLLALSLLMVIIPSVSVYVESALNDLLGTNIRMAFQIIRVQKLAVLPAYFALGLWLLHFLRSRSNVHKRLPMVFGLYLIMLVFANAGVFDKIPFIGDDISRRVLPTNLSLFEPEQEQFTALDKMMAYISEHTDKDAVFYGHYLVRSASKRSVVMDVKGASMIIEGNPKRFIQWFLDRNELHNKKLPEQIEFLKEKQVDYYITDLDLSCCADLVHHIENIRLYSLK